MGRSCIKGIGKDHPFSLKTTSVVLNTFFDLGSAGQGRRHIILIHKTTYDWTSLYIDGNAKYEHSPEFIQYFIKSVEDLVIGSLFIVNSKLTHQTPTTLSLNDSKEDRGKFICLNEAGSGGVHVYSDNEGSFTSIPVHIEHPWIVQED